MAETPSEEDVPTLPCRRIMGTDHQKEESWEQSKGEECWEHLSDRRMNKKLQWKNSSLYFLIFWEKKKYVSLSRHWVCCYQRYSVQAMKWYIGGIQPLSGRWSYIIHTIFWHCISEYIKKNPLIIGFLISMTATSIMLSTESNLKAFANRTNTFFSKFKGFSYLLSPCLT